MNLLDALNDAKLEKIPGVQRSDLDYFVARLHFCHVDLIRLLRLADEDRAVNKWPHVFEEDDLSPQGRAHLARWRKQWEKLPLSRLRRCKHPQCPIEGGRYFLARTNDKDCRYCRRGASKSTRWRRRSGAVAVVECFI